MMSLVTNATSADESARGARVAVLPIGSFEQHGEHLPLATDSVIACLIAQRIATDHDLFLLPPITMSCSHEHAFMTGTVSISAVTLYAVVGDIWRSLQASGIQGLIIVNGHGGNYVLSNFVQEASVDGPHVTLFPNRDDWQQARGAAALETTSTEDMHGGELEVSLLLYGAPELVREGVENDDHSAPSRPHLLSLGMSAYTKSGIIGSPSLASAHKGKVILESLSHAAKGHLRVLSGGN